MIKCNMCIHNDICKDEEWYDEAICSRFVNTTLVSIPLTWHEYAELLTYLERATNNVSKIRKSKNRDKALGCLDHIELILRRNDYRHDPEWLSIAEE